MDSLPFEIPFGLATTFKSDEDWLDDWEEVSQVVKKPYTFDDRVEDYRSGFDPDPEHWKDPFSL